jgi:hypothetical protein
MADDRGIRGPVDRLRINVNEDHELEYWTKELGVPPERLRQLVNAFASWPQTSARCWVRDNIRPDLAQILPGH